MGTFLPSWEEHLTLDKGVSSHLLITPAVFPYIVMECFRRLKLQVEEKGKERLVIC